MQPTVTLNLSDEFRVACLLYNLQPEAFLQDFILKVMLPSKYLVPEPESILATRFLIDYVNLKEFKLIEENYGALKKVLSEVKVKIPSPSGYTEEQIEFLRKKERQRLILSKNRLKYGKEEGEEAMRFFLKIWLREWEERFG